MAGLPSQKSKQNLEGNLHLFTLQNYQNKACIFLVINLVSNSYFFPSSHGFIVSLMMALKFWVNMQTHKSKCVVS